MSPLQTTRIVAVAILAGVMLYAGVAIAVTASGAAPIVEAGEILVQAFIGLTLAGFIGWYLVSRGVSERASRAGVDAAAVQRPLIIAWALLEAPALLGVTVTILTGAMWTTAVAIGLVAVGIGLSFPRREWFSAN